MKLVLQNNVKKLTELPINRFFIPYKQIFHILSVSKQSNQLPAQKI